MSNTLACRICLVTRGPLLTILNTSLQDFYEKLTNSLLLQSQKPHQLCSICHALLTTFYKFTSKAIRSDQYLTQLLQNGKSISQFDLTNLDRKPFNIMTLTTTPIENITINPEITTTDPKIPNLAENNLHFNTEPIVAQWPIVESAISLKTVVKNEMTFSEEDSQDYKESGFQCEPSKVESDSEDDIPLNNVLWRKGSKREANTPDREEEKIVDKDYRYSRAPKSVKDFAREMDLSVEQQLEEMRERSQSLNYVNAPLKCDDCFRGFNGKRAFENHRAKHDVKSGPHVCEICHLRYRKPRLLRIHKNNSHAKLYECIKCRHRTHTKMQARDHEKWHTGFTYECKLCGHKFGKPTSYLTHVRKHHPTQHACTQCGESFISRHGLAMHRSKSHFRAVVPETPPQLWDPAECFCAECDIQFESRDAWQRHVLTAPKHRDHTHSPSTSMEPTSLKCKICSATQPSPAALKAHMRDHEKALRADTTAGRSLRARNAKLACDQCGTFFLNRSKLQAHMKRIHLGLKYNKNIVCEVCGKKCTSNASLVYHQRTHTGEKPYKCETCKKTFSNGNLLKIHIRVHTGERPYCCSVCGKRFSQKPALNRHHLVHTGAKPYTCPYCSKTFSQSSSMKLHVNSIHLKLPTLAQKRRKAGLLITEESSEMQDVKQSVI